MSDLPPGIHLNQGEIASIPKGALYTDPNVARVCVRCKHEECPCCQDHCDSCINDDVEGDDRRDGDFIIRTYNVNGEKFETSTHVKCAEDLKCNYNDTAPHILMAELFRAERKRFANIGGHFGITDDLRVWYHGKTPQEVLAEEAERARLAAKLMKQATRDRAGQMKLFEKQFLDMNHFERAAYIAGMNHASQLVVWRTEDAERCGLKTSTRMGKEFIAHLNADIEHMNGLRSK